MLEEHAMATNDKRNLKGPETTDEARRRFLKLAGKAAIATPASVTLILAAGTKKSLAYV